MPIARLFTGDQDQVELVHSRPMTYRDYCVTGGKNRRRYRNGVAAAHIE